MRISDWSSDVCSSDLDNNIDRIDGVFWTHDHADHCHGIDDLRVLRYGRGGPIPGFASSETVRRLRQRFSYVFSGQNGYPTIATIETLDRLRRFAGFAVDWGRMHNGEWKAAGEGKSV